MTRSFSDPENSNLPVTCHPKPLPLPPWTRASYFLCSVLLPVIFIAVHSNDQTLIMDLWQNGTFKTYTTLHLNYRAMIPFFPGIAYSITCLGIYCFFPTSLHHTAIQLGIFAGAVLSVQYTIMTAIATTGASIVIGVIALICIWPFLLIALRFFFGFLPPMAQVKFSIQKALIAVAGIGLLCWLVKYLSENPVIANLFFPLTILHLGTTFTASLPFIHISFLIPKHWSQPTKDKTSSTYAWAISAPLSLIYFFVAWRESIRIVAHQYSQLPKQPPHDCFVCTAGAFGHRRFVGTYQNSSNQSPVNRQMQYVKILEFSLQKTSPFLHRGLRRIYNFLGPKLARILKTNRFLADLAYLSLLPAHFAGLLLARSLGISSQTVEKFYRAPIADRPKKL